MRAAAMTLLLILAGLFGLAWQDPPPEAGVFPGEVPRDVSDDPRPPKRPPSMHILPVPESDRR